MKPRLLDLFCGAGGAAVGYHRAGFDVIGVDIELQRHYPFEFHQGDAMTFPLDGFDAIHASPPCQAYTTMNNRHRSLSPRLIKDTRRRLCQTGLPYVIENVLGARRWMINPVRVNGDTFGLGVYRPRYFESSHLFLCPPRRRRQPNAAAVYGKQDGRRLWTRRDGSELRVATLEEARTAMGIDWMDWDEIKEAIPPAYTEWIGAQLLQHLQREAA